MSEAVHPNNQESTTTSAGRGQRRIPVLVGTHETLHDAVMREQEDEVGLPIFFVDLEDRIDAQADASHAPWLTVGDGNVQRVVEAVAQEITAVREEFPYGDAGSTMITIVEPKQPLRASARRVLADSGAFVIRRPEVFDVPDSTAEEAIQSFVARRLR